MNLKELQEKKNELVKKLMEQQEKNSFDIEKALEIEGLKVD